MDAFINYIQVAKHLADNIAKNEIGVGIHIVLGNESCDLDSMISALALAYLRYQEKHSVVPVMNMDSNDFLLHTENCYILKQLNIDADLLLFRNTIDLEKLHKKGLLTLSLVDHHVLQESDRVLKSSVVEVFDHRPVDTQASWASNIDCLIVHVGSCATLIAQQLLQYCELKSNIMTESLAVLLYSAIVFDTIGFNKDAGKTTPTDVGTAEKLKNQFNSCTNKDPQQLFEELWCVHNDVSHLTPKQLLSKDLKVVEGVPVPGLPMLVADFFKLPNASNDMIDFCLTKNSKVMVLIGLHVINTIVQRDVAVLKYEDTQCLANAIIEALKSAEGLQLLQIDVHTPHIVYFRQHNVKLTRKFILPLIKQVVSCRNQNSFVLSK